MWLYYKEGGTQEEIAQRLGLTRKRVNRIIGQALATGLVQITIDSRHSACPDLEARLKARYGLRVAKVVPAPAPDVDVRMVVGAAAGQFLSETLGETETLGITWGGDLRRGAEPAAARGRQHRRVADRGAGLQRPDQSLRCGGPVRPRAGRPVPLRTAPKFADLRELRDALLQSAPVADVLGRVRSIDRALLSAIDLTHHSKALEYGVISGKTWRSLREAGAVGDIAGQYLELRRAGSSPTPSSIA